MAASTAALRRDVEIPVPPMSEETPRTRQWLPPRAGSRDNLTAMTSEAPHGRLLTAMATAFDSEGAVDLEATGRIAAHLVEHGNDGVVVSGTTGESPTTSPAENAEIIRAVKAAVGDRAQVIAGVGSNATAHSLELAVGAEKAGADGVLLVSPYYNKPSQAGLLQHFSAVAQATQLPVMLYDVPPRTAVTIELGTYEALRALDNVTSVKDATGLLPRTAELVDLGFAVYSGDDVNTLGYLAYGAVGLVSVVGHVAGDRLAAMIDAFVRGEHTEAIRLHTELAPVMRAVMGVPNYGATTAKAGLQLLGVLDNRDVRGPLVALDDREYADLAAALQAANLI